MTELEPTIRRARPDDAAAIAEVHIASWRSTYPGIVDQAYIDALSLDDRATTWARRLITDSKTAPDVLVAVDDGHLVGFLSGGLIREPFAAYEAELYAIYLLRIVQRQGLGRRLTREWARLTLAKGLSSAVVRVLAANPARFFYEALGAEAIRHTQLVIGASTYPEIWYGWRNLLDLTA